MVTQARGSIGVPSVRGMKDAFIDAAIGAGGGLVMMLSKALFGSGLIGALIAAVLGGSVIKGTRGTVIATVAGAMMFMGGTSQVSASSTSDTRGVQ
jgi:hypothetical protein